MSFIFEGMRKVKMKTYLWLNFSLLWHAYFWNLIEYYHKDNKVGICFQDLLLTRCNIILRCLEEHLLGNVPDQHHCDQVGVSMKLMFSLMNWIYHLGVYSPIHIRNAHMMKNQSMHCLVSYLFHPWHRTLLCIKWYKLCSTTWDYSFVCHKFQYQMVW